MITNSHPYGTFCWPQPQGTVTSDPLNLNPHPPPTPQPNQVCFRTLDLYTSAVLEAGLDPPSAPKEEWRGLMERLSLSRVSCDVGGGGGWGGS